MSLIKKVDVPPILLRVAPCVGGLFRPCFRPLHGQAPLSIH